MADISSKILHIYPYISMNKIRFILTNFDIAAFCGNITCNIRVLTCLILGEKGGSDIVFGIKKMLEKKTFKYFIALALTTGSGENSGLEGRALRCHAQVHRSQVVRPSAATLSSKNGGLGGGGTKCPFQRPFSLASNANGDSNVSSSMAFNQKSSSSLLAALPAPATPKLFATLSMAAPAASFNVAVARKSADIVGSYDQPIIWLIAGVAAAATTITTTVNVAAVLVTATAVVTI
ncbi:hypothetical protein FF38_06020 [Lucilia cuprina]|uniref:Uncharacterized protein n=1 Tax=Lucilia cuprina TaxID=7375 RepID=A0A0L0CGZ0_LUCCU|nr:hypothetical protein FF38_06020 [Lucilia cuprina]